MTTGQASSEPERQDGVPDELFTIHKALLDNLWALWIEHRDAATAKTNNHTKFSRVSIVTLTQVAAVTAADVGMTEEQFLAACKANYIAAVKRAPKFG